VAPRIINGAVVWIPGCLNPDCDPSDPLTGPCCNAAQCTWLPAYDANASDNTEAECIGPTNECKLRYCGTNHQCTVALSPDQNRADGEPCSPQFNKCLIGSCSAGACSTAAAAPRCSVAVCDPENCNQINTQYGYNWFQSCTDAALSNPPPSCNQVNNNVCYPMTCNPTTRKCEASAPPVTCGNSGVTTGTCAIGSCTFSNGTATCTSVAAPAGTSCPDVNPWDCNHHKCDGGGTGSSHCSVRVRKAAASGCDATPNDGNHCTLSTCTATGRCRTGTTYSYNLAYNTAALYLDVDTDGTVALEPTCTSVTPGACQHAACGGSSTTGLGDGTCTSTPDTGQNGGSCSTDTCTTQTCSNGTCNFVACKGSATA
jgi:hypothetical protein